MNISTYESRIKALEDQLNPPAPPVDPRTGIQSIVITPDVANSNARLASMMPIAPVPYDPDDSPVLFTNINSDVDPETEYVITVTPGTEYYASSFSTQLDEVSENPGDPITTRVTGNDFIDIILVATPDIPDEQIPPEYQSAIHLLIGNIM